MIKSEILLPLLNANEPEARLAGIHVSNGQLVKKGMLLFTIETTKAAADIESPGDGFIHIMAFEGDLLSVGKRLAVLTDLPGEAEQTGEKSNDSGGADIRITKPARKLAEELGIDLSHLPADKLITESIIRQYAIPETDQEVALPPSEKPYLLIYGAGGHAKSVIEIIQNIGKYTIAGIIDDDTGLTSKRILDIPVLGTKLLLPALISRGVSLSANCVGGILDINVRVRVFERLESSGLGFPALIHSKAVVESSAMIDEGAQVFANTYIGAEAQVGPRTIINTSAVVSHDCVVGKYTHIAPGALLAGHVHVGERTLVGMGVTTAIGIKIGAGVRIGNSAVILANVPDKSIVQAGRTWNGRNES